MSEDVHPTCRQAWIRMNDGHIETHTLFEYPKWCVAAIHVPLTDRELGLTKENRQYRHVIIEEGSVVARLKDGVTITEDIYTFDDDKVGDTDGYIIACHLSTVLDETYIRLGCKVHDLQESKGTIHQHKCTIEVLTDDVRRLETQRTERDCTLERIIEDLRCDIDVLHHQRDELNRRLDERTPDA